MRSDRYGAYNLTTADEPLYRALRDGFRGAGLNRAQFTQALEWYRDQVRPGLDENALHESFHEFAANKGWDVAQIVGAQSIHAAVRDQGPDAITVTPTADEDRATIERANELMRTKPEEYWRNTELQELSFEATERQQAAPQATSVGPAPTDTEIERRMGQRDVEKFERMMREQPREWWGSPKHQADYRAALERANLAEPEGPAPVAPAPPPGVPAVPSVPAAEPAPAAAAPTPVPIVQGATP
jgi:hypothetical protein